MTYRLDFDNVALPVLGASLFSVMFLAVNYPLLLALIPVAIAGTIAFFKNQPCDPKHVRNFFNGFRVGGHRGSPHCFPENSLSGFIQAKADGADLIEFDVAMTKDGFAILLHDDDLDRTTNMTGPVREKTLEELKDANIAANFKRTVVGQLSPVTNEGIPSLESVVKWAVDNKIKMLFDVKDSDTELVVIIANLFEKYQLYDKAIVCSFYPWVVHRIKQSNQRILTGLTWRQKFFSYHDIENKRPRYSGIKHYVFVIIDIFHVSLLKTVTPWFLGADLLLTNNLDISKTFVMEQRIRGLHVAVWTVNDMAEMHWMLEHLGVPVITDHPYYTKKVVDLQNVVKNGYLS